MVWSAYGGGSAWFPRCRRDRVGPPPPGVVLQRRPPRSLEEPTSSRTVSRGRLTYRFWTVRGRLSPPGRSRGTVEYCHRIPTTPPKKGPHAARAPKRGTPRGRTRERVAPEKLRSRYVTATSAAASRRPGSRRSRPAAEPPAPGSRGRTTPPSAAKSRHRPAYASRRRPELRW